MSQDMLSQYTQTYTSFSGADIVASFTPHVGRTVVIGELQAITYSVTREKAPVYTMGSPDPRSFSRGKRGIAGSLVFTVFDRDALIDAMRSVEDEGRGSFTQTFTRVVGDVGVSRVDKWGNPPVDPFTIDDETGYVLQEEVPVEYADQLMPFNVTISFVNEYGKKAVLRILGVEILNEGSGMSIDDITTDKACTFVARGIEYLKPLGPNAHKHPETK